MTGLSRRNVLIGSLVAAAAVGAGVGGAAPALAAPIDDQLAELERRDNVLIGLYASNLDSGRRITHRADQMFAMCSTFKGYAAARVLQMAERGEISLDNRVFVDADALVPNSPVTETRAGAEMTLAELCQAALQRSDNTAANLLLKTIGGPAAVTAFARSVGDERTRLDRWEVELNSAIPGDPRDTSTPAALAVGYRAILAGDALSPSQRGLLEDWMRANQTFEHACRSSGGLDHRRQDRQWGLRQHQRRRNRFRPRRATVVVGDDDALAGP